MTCTYCGNPTSRVVTTTPPRFASVNGIRTQTQRAIRVPVCIDCTPHLYGQEAPAGGSSAHIDQPTLFHSTEGRQ